MTSIQFVTLGDLANFTNGKKRPGSIVERGVPVYGANGIIGKSDQGNFPEGTTIIGRVGSYCGSVHFSTSESWITDNAIGAVPRNGVNARYLFYLLKSKNLGLKRIGSGQPLLTQSILRTISTELVSQEDQCAIGDILGALDDKIAINERITNMTNDLAGALFQGCESSLQVISNVAIVTMGQSPPGETYNEHGTGLPFYQGNRDFGIRHPSRRVWCTAITRLADKGDVLVSVRAPVGEINVATEPCGIGRGVAALRAEKYPHVLLHALSSDRSVWRPYESAGTVFGSINRKQLTQLEIQWPGEQSIERLEEQLMALDERLLQAVGESQALATLRDTLLPQLMSGRLRIKKAEKIVEDAT